MYHKIEEAERNREKRRKKQEKSGGEYETVKNVREERGKKRE